MKKARISNVGNEMRLNSGQSGTRETLYSCTFWIGNFESESMAMQYCHNEARALKINKLYIQDDTPGENDWEKVLCQDEFNEKVYIEKQILSEWLDSHKDHKII